jgi:hypothetical protein
MTASSYTEIGWLRSISDCWGK